MRKPRKFDEYTFQELVALIDESGGADECDSYWLYDLAMFRGNEGIDVLWELFLKADDAGKHEVVCAFNYTENPYKLWFVAESLKHHSFDPAGRHANAIMQLQRAGAWQYEENIVYCICTCEWWFPIEF